MDNVFSCLARLRAFVVMSDERFCRGVRWEEARAERWVVNAVRAREVRWGSVGWAARGGEVIVVEVEVGWVWWVEGSVWAVDAEGESMIGPRWGIRERECELMILVSWRFKPWIANVGRRDWCV